MNNRLVNQSILNQHIEKEPIHKYHQLPSQREIQVLQLIAFEYTSKEIAECLYISRETVNTHRKNLMFKLKVKNVAGLIRKAFEVELLSLNVSSVA